MSLLGMRYFLVAAEEMNFTNAARRLYITQQTLSSHIQRLEQEYQVTLFKRKPRLALTPEGEQMVKYATRIIRLERVMTAEFADLDQAAKGVLSLGISRMRARQFFHEIWHSYRSQYPNMEIYLNEASTAILERLVATHKVDMCIGLDILPTPSLRRISLLYEALYLTVPRVLFHEYYGERSEEMIRRFVQGIPFEQIPDLPLLLLSPINRIRRIVDQQYDRLDKIVHPVFESNDLELITRMCESGVGLTFLPATILFCAPERNPFSDQLYYFPISELRLETVLGYPADMDLPHYAQAFIRCCQNVFAQGHKKIKKESAAYLEGLLAALPKGGSHV